MAAEPKKIKVAPGSELAKLLNEADKKPIVLEANGARYRLDRLEPEPEEAQAGHAAETAREAISRYAGSWRDVDAEAFKELIYRAREEGTRPPNRA